MTPEEIKAAAESGSNSELTNLLRYVLQNSDLVCHETSEPDEQFYVYFKKETGIGGDALRIINGNFSFTLKVGPEHMSVGGFLKYKRNKPSLLSRLFGKEAK